MLGIRNGRLFGALAILAMVMAAGSGARAAAAGLSRALYWDDGYPPAGTEKALADRLKAEAFDAVHLYLNGNGKTDPDCHAVFRYDDGTIVWTPGRLETLAAALHDDGIKPVLMISPLLRTKGYINSLSAGGGPLDVARRLGARGIDVDVELDIEANGDGALCLEDGLSADDADTLVVAAIRAATKGRLIVSSPPGFLTHHRVLVAAVDAIAPQLYGSRYGLTAKGTADRLIQFLKVYSRTPMIAALTVQCAKGEDAKNCSKDLYDAELQQVTEIAAKRPGRVEGYVIWGAREAHTCPHGYVCSTYAAKVLTHGGVD